MRYKPDSFLTLRESSEFLTKLNELADSQGISRSDLVRQCLRQRVSRALALNQKTGFYQEVDSDTPPMSRELDSPTMSHAVQHEGGQDYPQSKLDSGLGIFVFPEYDPRSKEKSKQ